VLWEGDKPARKGSLFRPLRKNPGKNKLFSVPGNYFRITDQLTVPILSIYIINNPLFRRLPENITMKKTPCQTHFSLFSFLQIHIQDVYLYRRHRFVFSLMQEGGKCGEGE
jgi:hypothetical protein